MRTNYFASLLLIYNSIKFSAGKQICDANLSCENDFILENKKCVKEIVQPVNYHCPLDYIFDEVECYKTSPLSIKCPPGSETVGKGNCRFKVARPAQPVCRIGFTDNGTECVSEEYLDIVEYCEQGHREGNYCVKTEILPYEITKSCLEKYELTKDGDCITQQTYDCTPPDVHHDNRKLMGISKPAAAKLNVKKQTCYRKEVGKIIINKSCPEGSEDTGESCVIKQKFKLQKKCINGLDVNNCKTIIKEPYKYDCEDGYLERGIVCNRYVHAEPIQYCERGLLLNNECREVHPMIPSCPVKLKLVGDVCVGKEIKEPISSCLADCTGENCNKKN